MIRCTGNQYLSKSGDTPLSRLLVSSWPFGDMRLRSADLHFIGGAVLAMPHARTGCVGTDPGSPSRRGAGGPGLHPGLDQRAGLRLRARECRLLGPFRTWTQPDIGPQF